MSSIAFIQKWHPNIHGHSINETKYVDYMKTKWLIIDTIETRYVTQEMLNDCLAWINLYRVDILRTHSDTVIELAVIKKRFLKFKKRHFAIPNNGLIVFQKKWKKYHKKKMKYIKATKNILYRQLHGKYPKFK